MFLSAPISALLLATNRPDELARRVLFGRGLFDSSPPTPCLPALPKPNVIYPNTLRRRRRNLEQLPDDEAAHVFFFNDLHGRLTQRLNEDGTAEYGAVSLAQTIQELRHRHKDLGNSILVSTGDNLGATEYICTALDERPVMDVLNVLHTRVVALGNHEFDRGIDWLHNKIDGYQSIPHLAANVYQQSDGSLLYRPSYIWVLPNGRKIGFVGVITQSVPLLVRSGGIAGVRFGNMVEAANREADILINEHNCDALVLLAHQGAATHAADASSDEWTDLVANLDSRYSAILSGHTHITYHQTHPILALQAGSYGSHVGHLVLRFSSAADATPPKAQGFIVDASRRNPHTDPFANDPIVISVREIVAQAVRDAEAGRRRIIGRTCRPITRATDTNGDIVRSEESQLVHFVADAMRAAAEQADIAIVNPGNVRGCLPGGVITADTLMSALPFNNLMVLLEMSGDLLLSLLRQQFQNPRLMLGISNMRFTYANSTILEVWIAGEPLDLKRKYRVMTNDFLAEGGDGFDAFKKARQIKRYQTLTDSLVAEQYLEKYSIVEAEPFERAIDLSRVQQQQQKDLVDVLLCIRSWTSVLIEVGISFSTAIELGDLRMGLILNVKGENVFAFGLYLSSDMYSNRRSFLSLEVPNTYPEDSIKRMELWVFSDTFDYNPFPNGVHASLTAPFPHCRQKQHGISAHI